jgi:hypothetical protein
MVVRLSDAVEWSIPLQIALRDKESRNTLADSFVFSVLGELSLEDRVLKHCRNARALHASFIHW